MNLYDNSAFAPPQRPARDEPMPRPGDVVHLRSGGVPMVVEAYTKPVAAPGAAPEHESVPLLSCIWHSLTGALYQREFAPHTVTLFEHEDDPADADDQPEAGKQLAKT